MVTLLRASLGLMLLWLSSTLPVLANGPIPSLDSVDLAISNMDTSQGDVLDDYWSKHYAQAPPDWQMRWHLLRCEVAHMESDGAEVQRQVSEGKALAARAGNTVIPLYLSLCESRYQYSQLNLEVALAMQDDVINQAIEQNDPALLALAYTDRAIARSDSSYVARAIDDLTLALRQAELVKHAPWQSVSLPQIYFVFGRTFYYLENYVRADESIKQAIQLVDPDTPLAWFIRFNYANVLSSQERLQEAQHQLDRLNDNPPHFGKFYRGYVELFRAELLLQLNRPQEAIPLARRAAMDFARVDLTAPYAKALIIEGQSNVMLGDREQGWAKIEQAQTLLAEVEENQGDWGYLAKSWRWAARYHHQQGNDTDAYLAMEQYAKVYTRFLEKQQADQLAQQQQKLSQEVDRHRQRLASSSEAQFQLEQSLLMWRGSTVVLGLIVMGVFIWRFWPVTHNKAAETPPEDWREHLVQLMNLSRQNERPLSVILARDADHPISRLVAQLERDLRPSDRVLQPDHHTALLLLDQATEGELAWRLASLTDLMRNSGRTDVMLAKARVHGFDDPESLLSRLEYELISQSIPSRSDPQGGV
ncbi:tetratricopeptide repeat protein [Ferrimonas balearica]|uniref:tetratricopeptide repeat protein n=1 Tax=Ferrimonas balearica TaxID=44012 RepID=UPI001C57F3CA|nr:hypothetical protein [Ferrimonas balearica]MBW3141423.1 hypothetical protein [Ferrimonas balearica]MBY6226090.1 hypothetical protein [Ferrimonas balearica]